MAKVFNELCEFYYVDKLEKLENDLKIEQEYREIYRQKKNDRILKKLHHFDLRFSHKVFPMEIKLGNVENFYNQEYRSAYKKIYFKIMLLKKAETQKYFRQSKKQVPNFEQLHLERWKLINDKEKDLANRLKVHYDKLIVKNSLDENQKKDLQKQYDLLNKNHLLKRDKLKNKLESKTAAKLETYLKKSDKKIARLQQKIALNHTKLNNVKKVYDKVLDDGVVLELNQVSMHFGGLKAVDQLSFKVYDGDIFGLIGPNGAGKTTVFNCITQFYKMTSGEAWFNNNENVLVKLNDLKVYNVIKHGIARTFQNVELAWELSILDNLKVAAHSLYKSSLFDQFFHTRKYLKEEEIITKKALDVLDYLDLSAYKDVPPLGLPYGILKRIELARTLMSNPKLIILDEPAAGLNDKETAELSELIIKIKNDYHATIFLVEHDMGLVMNICNRICAISFGKLLAIGTPEEIQNNKNVQEAYLGGE